MKKIAAGIVTFNPEPELLKKNISAICEQVDYTVIFDNGSSNLTQITEIIDQNPNIHVIANESNLGIAEALNRIMIFCENMGSEWVITLDQDSVAPQDFIKGSADFIKERDVAIVCPEADYGEGVESSQGWEEKKVCITSGAITNIGICREIGFFNSKLFIDLVDFEYCIRLIKNGYRIVKLKKYVMMHKLGDLETRFIGWKKVYVTNHNAIRIYFFTRNLTYLQKKYGKEINGILGRWNLSKLLIKIILFEKNKVDKVFSLFKGIVEGKKMEKDVI